MGSVIGTICNIDSENHTDLLNKLEEHVKHEDLKRQTAKKHKKVLRKFIKLY